jgi:P-type conjugative transfer protein TrbJ
MCGVTQPHPSLVSMPRWRTVPISVLLACALLMRPARSVALSTFAGALEPTQIANFIQLVEHTVHFIQMVRKAAEQVRRWKQNLEGLGKGHFGSIRKLVGLVGSAVDDYRSITYGAQSLLKKFSEEHPGFKPPANSMETYTQLDKQTVAMVEESLKTIDATLSKEAMNSQDDLVKELEGKIEGAEGTVKALQITNHLLVLLTKQMEKLLLVVGADARQMSAYVANETQRRSSALAERHHVVTGAGNPPKADPIDWSTSAFGAQRRSSNQGAIDWKGTLSDVAEAAGEYGSEASPMTDGEGGATTDVAGASSSEADGWPGVHGSDGAESGDSKTFDNGRTVEYAPGAPLPEDTHVDEHGQVVTDSGEVVGYESNGREVVYAPGAGAAPSGGAGRPTVQSGPSGSTTQPDSEGSKTFDNGRTVEYAPGAPLPEDTHVDEDGRVVTDSGEVVGYRSNGRDVVFAPGRGSAPSGGAGRPSGQSGPSGSTTQPGSGGSKTFGNGRTVQYGPGGAVPDDTHVDATGRIVTDSGEQVGYEAPNGRDVILAPKREPKASGKGTGVADPVITPSKSGSPARIVPKAEGSS